MAGTTTTKNLYLAITGNASGLTTASKAAKSALLDVAASAADLQKSVQDSFQKLGGGDMLAAANAMEAGYKKSFSAIRAAAEQALTLPKTDAGGLNLNLPALQEQLATAEGAAASYRAMSDAMVRAAGSSDQLNAAQRVLVTALEGSAQAAEQEVLAYREAIAVMQPLQAELDAVAVSSEEAAGAADAVAGAHNRMGASGLIVDHVIRSFTDSIVAGQDPVRALAMELPRVAEAMQLVALVSGETEGAMGRFAAFMGGEWGIAVTAGISIVAALTESLLGNADSADKNAQAHDALKDALDRLAGAEATANHQTLLGIEADIQAAQATRQREIATRGLLAAKIQSAQADLAASKTGLAAGGLDATSAAALGRQATVADEQSKVLENQLIANQKSIDDANKAILSGATKIIQRQIEGASDPKSKINQTFEDAADRLDRRFQSGELTPEAYRSQYTQITNQRDSGLESLKPGRKPRVDHSVERAANIDRAYQAELNQAQDAYAKAQLALADTAQGRLKVETDELQASLQQKLLEIDDQVTAKKISSMEADKLKALAIATEALQEEAARRKEQSELLATQLQHDELQLQGSTDLLNLQNGLATTTKQRRDIALQLLALDEQRLRDEQNKVIADPTSTPDQIKDANLKLDQIDQQHPFKVQQIDQQNTDPMQAYLTQLHQATDDTNSALEGVEVDGLKGLQDGLVGIITGTETVASAFKKMATSIISDLARIAIEKAIVGALGGVFGGSAFSGTTSAGTGGVYGGDLGGVYAAGGHIVGPGTGTSDSILARVSNGEFVMNAAATSRNLPLLMAMNDNRLPGFASGGRVGGDLRLPDLSPDQVAGLTRPSVSIAFGDTHLYAPGADPAQLARLQSAFEQSQKELPARATAAVKDALDRRVIRA